MRLSKRIGNWLGFGPGGWFDFGPKQETTSIQPVHPVRERVDHVVILDGTMSSLEPGFETNAGQLYKLLREIAPSRRLSVCYEAGIQWNSWKTSLDVIEGRGINRQIKRIYGFVASRYRPGDRIFLFGYSRGAYAVRSLAGMIDRVGLLKPEYATVRDIRQIYRFYRDFSESPAQTAFVQRRCETDIPIEVVGVWDTVKALGLRLPVLWRWTEPQHRFHNHALGHNIRHGFHALALDETRKAYAPVIWETPEFSSKVEQVWFRGSHGDVGGHLNGFNAARPLANIPFVWMLERAQTCGLTLPGDWRARFPCDAAAPSVGTWRGWGKLFWSRRKRIVGRDPSETIHPSAARDTAQIMPHRPRARN